MQVTAPYITPVRPMTRRVSAHAPLSHLRAPEPVTPARVSEAACAAEGCARDCVRGCAQHCVPVRAAVRGAQSPAAAAVGVGARPNLNDWWAAPSGPWARCGVRHWATCGCDGGRMRLVQAGVPRSVHSYLRLEEDEGQIEAVARRREVVEQAAALGAGGRAGAALSSMGCAPVGSRSKGSPASGRPARSSIRALPA